MYCAKEKQSMPTWRKCYTSPVDDWKRFPEIASQDVKQKIKICKLICKLINTIENAILRLMNSVA